MSWCGSLFMVLLLCMSVSSQECQRVVVGVREFGTTVSPVTYNGIEPDTTSCSVGERFLECGAGQGVLSDGNIGPTHSVDLTDSDQVQRFFVWDRDNGSVVLEFRTDPIAEFTLSYIDIYTLTVPSAKIGPPATTRFRSGGSGSDIIISPESCNLSSSGNTLTRNIYSVSVNLTIPFITFEFNEGTDWLFISEIMLCSGDPPSPITCSDIPTTTTTPSPTPSTPSPPPTPPPITLSSPPASRVTVTPDLSQPDSVTLSCSVASPATDDYQYQWQWQRNGAQLSSGSRLTITHTTNTQSTSLLISGLQHSDAGEYMCRVEYASCPDGVDCSEATPVTGTIALNLPVVVEVESDSQILVTEGSVVVLSCEVYGYPRDSSPPVWTSSQWTSDELQSGRFSTSLTNENRLSDSSVPSSERVVSQLTIVNVTAEDSGEYTCEVTGNSTSISLTVVDGGLEGESNGGLIVGVVIAVLVFIIALVATISVILLMVWRYHKDGKLDSCSCYSLSCRACSCVAVRAALGRVRMPTTKRGTEQQHTNKNGDLVEQTHTIDTTENQVYSVVQKSPKKAESPPPPPPMTLTEMELSELMGPEEDADASPPADEMRSRRNTVLSTYSQSGSSPRLAKLTKLKNFKMKKNPIYQSADELALEDIKSSADSAIYALPSKGSSRRSNRTSGSMTNGPNSERIYSEPIDPSMFTKRASAVVPDEDLHPMGPIYAKPVRQKERQPLYVNEGNIQEVKQIGVGQFGAVLLGKMSGLSASDVKTLPEDTAGPGSGVLLVAVKRLKPDASDEVRQSFDKEIKFMSQLQHENIVQLLAVCTQRDNPFIVMEYMENGDLNQFLQRYTTINDDEALYSNQIPTSSLLHMAVQIASGMCYLSSLNYVHRDLATRNCLVGSNFRVKISDFGMSRNLYERVYYRVRGRAMLPIRWMATESFYGRFSEKSDVWAFGVVVWEIFTLGKKQPYEELDDQDMIQDAIRGTGRRIMSRPEGCPQGVFEVMLSCWEYAAADRTTFKDIHQRLQQSS